MQCAEPLRAIVMLQTGRSHREVANTFNVSKSEISRLWNRYQQIQNVDDRPHSGRPRTTGVQDRFIRNQALRNRSQTANQIERVSSYHIYLKPELVLDDGITYPLLRSSTVRCSVFAVYIN